MASSRILSLLVPFLLLASLLPHFTHGFGYDTTPLNIIGWGANTLGQLGRGSCTVISGPSSATLPRSLGPEYPSSAPIFESIASGERHAIATADSGRQLWTWGANYENQLGLASGSNSIPYREHPILVPDIPGFTYPVKQIAAGAINSFVLDSAGVVFWSGSQLAGFQQVLPPVGQTWTVTNVSCSYLCLAWNTTHFSSPVERAVQPVWTDFPPGEGTMLATGRYNLFMYRGTKIYGRGDNFSNQISGTSIDQFADFEPLDFASPSPVLKLAVCSNHTLILREDGLYARGLPSDASPFGINTTGPTTAKISDGFGSHIVTDIGCAGQVSFVILDGERLVSWGDRSNSLLGRAEVPEDVFGVDNCTVLRDVSLGSASDSSLFIFAIKSIFFQEPNYGVMSWGRGDLGQLINADPIIASPPIPATAFPTNIIGTVSSPCNIYGLDKSTWVSCGANQGNSTDDVVVFGASIHRSTYNLFSSSLPQDTRHQFFAATNNAVFYYPDQESKLRGLYEVFEAASKLPQTPLGSYDSSINLPAGQVVTGLECGYIHCAIITYNNLNSTVFMWGTNTNNQIFPGGTGLLDSLVPWTFSPESLTVTLSLSYSIVCTTTSIFLRNAQGVREHTLPPGKVTSAASGYSHSLLVIGKKAWGYGDNSLGQLAIRASSVDYLIDLNLPAKSVAALSTVSFILDLNGDVWSFGTNSKYGELSHYNYGMWPPTKVPLGNKKAERLCQGCRGSSMAVVISSQNSSIATSSISTPGKVRVSFGDNRKGLAGVGTTSVHTLPVAIGITSDQVFSSRIGVSYSTQAQSIVDTPAGLMQWGDNSLTNQFGESGGYGYSSMSSPRPIGVPTGVQSISHVGGRWSEIVITQPGGIPYRLDSSTGSWVLVPGIENAKAVFDWFTVSQQVITFVLLNGTWVNTDPYASLLMEGSIPTGAKLIKPLSAFVSTGEDFVGYWIEASSTVSYSGKVIDNIEAVEVGRYFAVLLDTQGVVRTIGKNIAGSLGVPAPLENEYNVLTSLPKIKSISTTQVTAYTLDYQGRVFFWGEASKFGLGGFWFIDRVIASPMELTWLQSYPSADSQLPAVYRYAITSMTTTMLGVHIFMTKIPIDDRSCPESSRPTVTSGLIITCQNGVWIIVGDVSGGTQTPIVIPSPVIIDGSITVPSGSTIEILPSSGTNNPSITVTGCANISGTVSIVLTSEDLERISKNGGSEREIALLSASCGSFNGELQFKAPDSCRKIKSTNAKESQSESGGYALNAVFKVDSSRCNRWWIILVSVLGGILLLILIIVLLALFTPLKFILRPYSKRSNPTA